MKPVTGLFVIVLGMGLLSTSVAYAQERLRLDGTSISGNLELPSAETGVAWAASRTMKQKTGSVIMFKGHVLSKKYTPIDVNVFQRQLQLLVTQQ